MEKAAAQKFKDYVKASWSVSDDLACDVWKYWKATQQVNKYIDMNYNIKLGGVVPDAAESLPKFFQPREMAKYVTEGAGMEAAQCSQMYPASMAPSH